MKNFTGQNCKKKNYLNSSHYSASEEGEKEKKKVWDSNYNRLFDLQLGDTQCTRALVAHTAAAAAKSLQSCPTLCDLIDGSSLGSSVPGILQARTLEWVTISFSNA